MLHPARTLTLGDVRAVAGFSGNVSLGGFADALRNANGEAASNPTVPGPAGTDETYAKGALVAASVAPGLAPIAGARVGIGFQAEGGLAYTGRAVRVDLRRSFDLSPTWSLSLGAGGSSVLFGRQGENTLPNVDLGSIHGWGADVPVLLGFQSEGDLYMAWLGARAGWEHVDLSPPASAQPFGTTPISLSASRLWAGGLAGFAVGFRHLHVAVELDASYASVQGSYNGNDTQVTGLILVPSSAIWWRF